MRWAHRPALDGLRTLAVYAVVLYHCGVSVVAGGFIGVDLFFVLSGFLVTSVLLTEMHNTGRIRIGRFYARRVRRLLPAALAVVLATSALFAVITTASERLTWGGDARAALLYVSNWRFISSESDYFGADTSQSPFLHFWSLSIEEQFYLGLPLLLILLFRLRRRWYPAVLTGLGLLLVASIGMQIYWAQVNATHAYYGTDARVYQLLLGAVAALVWRESVLAVVGDDPQREPGPLNAGDRIRGAIAWLLLAGLLVVGSSLLDLSVSWRGLLAAFLSMALVWALTDEWSRSLTRLFALPTLTYLGRISYGTYLWHWPMVLAFGLVLDTQPWVLAVIVGLTATGMAALSHTVLESPIRRPSWLDTVPVPCIAAGLTASLVLGLGVAPRLLDGQTRPQLVASSVARVVHSGAPEPVPAGIDFAKYAADLGMDPDQCTAEDLTSCRLNQGAGANVMLIGDSHARQFSGTLAKLASEHDFTLYTAGVGGCLWQWGIRDRGRDWDEKGCVANRQALYEDLLTRLRIDVVVLVQRNRDQPDPWASRLYADGVSGDLEEVHQVTVTRTLDRLHELGIKTVIVSSMLAPEDSGVGNPLTCLESATDAASCQVPVPEQPPLMDALYRSDIIGRSDQALIDINPVMCSAWPVCSALDGDVPVWRDSQHFTSKALMKHRSGIWRLLSGTGFLSD